MPETRQRITNLINGCVFKGSFLLAFIFCFNINYAQSWFQLADFPGVERDDGASFVIKDIAYCGSGVVPFVALGDFYAFDLLSESWDTISPLPTGQERQYAAAFSNDSLGFLFGGFAGSFLNDLWQYDPYSDQWTQKSALPAEGRGGAACFVIDSFAYIIGGKTDSAEAIAEVWSYNLYTDEWQQQADLPFGNRWRASSSSNSTDGFLAFGLDESLIYHDEVYSYDPSLDQWQQTSVFPNGGRNYVKMHHFNGKLICIAGYDSTAQFLNEVWSYDLNRSIWDSLPALPSSGRRGGISFQSSSAIYYTTGLGTNGVRFKESWKLEDPTKLQEFGQAQENIVRLYPNPSSGLVNLWVSGMELNEKSYYRLYNQSGGLLFEGLLQEQQIIDLRSLSKGIIILDVRIDQKHLIRKLVKY